MWWVCSFLWASWLLVLIQPAAPVKAPVVAEWGSGVTPRLDPDTISKHVKQMVDVSLRRLKPQPPPFTFTSSLLGQNKAELWSLMELLSLCCPLQSIMKNYDPHQEGYISLEEFEKIASNFPFSFCTQETDR